MIAKGAHHVSLIVSDVERSRAFYGQLLGLGEIERPDFGIPGAWYDAGPIQLHLIVPPQGMKRVEPSLNPIAPHTAFEIEDYAEVCEALRKNGLDLLETGAAVGQIFVNDPDGNLIELIAPGGRLGRGR